MNEILEIKAIISSLIKATKEISDELALYKTRILMRHTFSDTNIDIAFTCPCCGNTIIQIDVPSDNVDFISFECDKCNTSMEWLASSRSEYRNMFWNFDMPISKHTQ